MRVYLEPANDVSGAAAPEGRAQATETPRQRPADPDVHPSTPDAARLAASLGEHDTKVVSGGRTVEFSFEESLNRVIVRVRSTDTGEIVRQIPPEDYLRFLARFQEMIGLLLDETA